MPALISQLRWPLTSRKLGLCQFLLLLKAHICFMEKLKFSIWRFHFEFEYFGAYRRLVLIIAAFQPIAYVGRIRFSKYYCFFSSLCIFAFVVNKVWNRSHDWTNATEKHKEREEMSLIIYLPERIWWKEVLGKIQIMGGDCVASWEIEWVPRTKTREY